MTELELFRRGDKKSIELIYTDCFASISRWVLKNSGTLKEAEDLFQDALVAVFQKSKEKDFELTCKLSTFIYGVAKKIWLYKLRTRGRYVQVDFGEEENLMLDESMVDSIAESNEVESLYRKSFKKLTDECQRILTHFFNGSSMKEIVQMMNYSNDSVARKRKFNCKNELVRLVKADPSYSELTQEN